MTAPDSYLQLLSLRHESYGFLQYQNFIFLCSPPLKGKYIDYRAKISKFFIIDGDSLCSFYFRLMWLFSELHLAHLQDGNSAALLEHFLDLLSSTSCYIILAETFTSWKKICAHHRLPNHMTQSLPWTLHQVLRDLEIAKITTLHFSETLQQPSSHLSFHITTPVANFTSLTVPESSQLMTEPELNSSERYSMKALNFHHAIFHTLSIPCTKTSSSMKSA